MVPFSRLLDQHLNTLERRIGSTLLLCSPAAHAHSLSGLVLGLGSLIVAPLLGAGLGLLGGAGWFPRLRLHWALLAYAACGALTKQLDSPSLDWLEALELWSWGLILLLPAYGLGRLAGSWWRGRRRSLA